MMTVMPDTDETWGATRTPRDERDGPATPAEKAASHP